MAGSNMRQFINELAKKKGYKMKLTIIESPYAGDMIQNTLYARQCVADSIAKGEAPIASHLLYTQDGILEEEDPEQRELGIKCGLAWLPFADIMAVYTDFGISKGMHAAIAHAHAELIEVQYRTIIQDI